VPSFSSIILKSQNLDLQVSPSLTDSGLCTTVNGQSIEETYEDSNTKMKDFKKMLGVGGKSPFKPKLISGSGNKHHKKMWLNVRDVRGQVETEGMIRVAINDWKDYVSVRYKIIYCVL
jgi:hypothetical protein